jgi:hypothetical protein
MGKSNGWIQLSHDDRRRASKRAFSEKNISLSNVEEVRLLRP